ncbi:MAG TPA: MFS transporter [Opitutaceae bacterium]|jgi:GPH family glycoside/pentoside/hexuronide:cation symporter
MSERIASDPAELDRVGAATAVPPATRPEDRLGVGEKAAVGAGTVALYYGCAGVKNLVVPVYQMVLGLSPTLVGLLLAAPRLWDGVTDSAVGIFSDNYRSRLGRRKPVIVVGALLQAVAFGLLWMAPHGIGQTWTAAYLLGALFLFYTCYSVFSVPFMSLSYEMTPDYDERTRLAVWGGFFAKIAEISYSWVFWVASLAIFGSVLAGIHIMGWVVAVVVMAICGAIPGLFVRERYLSKATRQPKVQLAASLRAVAGNRAFMVLAALAVLQVMAGMIASNTDYYLLVYHVCGGSLGEGSKWKGILSTAYAVVGIASLYPINWLAARFGKTSTLMMVFGLVFCGGFVKWVVFTPGNPWRIVADALICGPIWPALQVLTPAMFADVCDEDELNHGLRREGIFSAVFSWVQKCGYSLGSLASGVALDLTGFSNAAGGHQRPGTILGLRLLLAVSTSVWAAVAIALLGMYPLGGARARRTRELLEARRGLVNAPSSPLSPST